MHNRVAISQHIEMKIHRKIGLRERVTHLLAMHLFSGCIPPIIHEVGKLP